jgi:hypothetical protein
MRRPRRNREPLLRYTALAGAEVTEREPLRSLSSCRQALQVRASPVTHHFDYRGERPSIRRE